LALLFLPAYVGHYHGLGLSEQAVTLICVVFGLMVAGSALALLSFARRRWLVGLASLTVGMGAAFFCTHQVLLELQPWRSSHGLAKLIMADFAPERRIVLEVEKDDPFEYEQVAGLGFYTGQSIDLLRRRNPPTPSLPLQATERFLLGEMEFRQLWSSAVRVYLVTDSLLDGDGVLDQRSTFRVLGQLGKRWLVTNQPSELSSAAEHSSPRGSEDPRRSCRLGSGGCEAGLTSPAM
jgi:hypothetical protein